MTPAGSVLTERQRVSAARVAAQILAEMTAEDFERTARILRAIETPPAARTA